MSASHAPGHVCDRCVRRAVRLATYQARMRKLATPAAKRRHSKLEQLRRNIAALYRSAPADITTGRVHDHRQGRRHRIEANRRRWARRARRRITRALRPAVQA